MNIAKETAKRMLQNIDQQLQSLAQEQQSMNGNRGGQPSDQLMCFGGRIRRRMAPGGYIDDTDNPGGYTVKPQNWADIVNGFGQDQYKVNFNLPAFNAGNQKKVALPVSNQSPNNPWANNPFSDLKYNAPNADMNIPQADMGSLNNWQNNNVKFSNPADNPLLGGGRRGLQRPGNSGSAMDWLGMLPGIFNLGAGLMAPKAQRLNPNQFYNQDANRALSMMPTQFRIDPQLAEARNAMANNYRNINNQANSRGERMANYGSATNQYNSAVGNLYAEKNNQENTYARERAGMLNEQGQQRANVNMGVQNMNDENRAAALRYRMGYLGAGVSDVQKNYLVNKQMVNQQAAQMAWIRAITQRPYWGNWTGLDPNSPTGIKQ